MKPEYYKITKMTPFSKRGGELSKAGKKIFTQLKKLKVGEGFLIPTSQCGSVRRIKKIFPEFKDYNITIRAHPDDKKVCGVFRVEKKMKKVSQVGKKLKK